MTDANLTTGALRTPKAAAIAGIVFSILLVVIFVLLRFSLPTDPSAAIEVFQVRAETLALAISLIPFAGVAFLWFVGVIRDRLGLLEDRLFATVFLGSGLLFLAMLFCAAAVVSATALAFPPSTQKPIDESTFAFARNLTFTLMNVYAIKMAAVFMITTSTVAAHTRVVPKYVAYLGYPLALFILLGSQYQDWSFFIFPLWVLLLSSQILIDNYRHILKVRS
jgi:hypothetical protein